MRAVIAREAGDASVLAIGSAPDPHPGPGEALIRVRGTSVNRADILQRRGLYPPPPGASDILGLEAVGEVITSPAGAAIAPGDRVMCLVPGGAYAELVAAPASNCIPIPEGMPFEEAAAVPEVFITAFHGLMHLGALQPGDTALVHAVASGVGTAAAQICAAAGARCIGTSRSPERAAAAARWGAEPLPVTAGSFAPSVMSMTDGHGADVILDLVGARYLQDNIACLARHGRIVLTGLVGGRRGEADLGTLLAHQGTIAGSTLRGSTVGEKAEIMRAFADWALPLFNTGVLRPVVHGVLPMSEVARAHQIVERDEAVGCVVLVVP